MDEQSRFRTALAALSASAEQKNQRLEKKDVEAFFRDMNLGEDQQPLVYAYLASRHIQVEGVEMPLLPADERPYTEEEQEFLRQYQKELKRCRMQDADTLPRLFEKAADGEAVAKKLLTEHYMKKVLELAQGYAHRGLLLQDLVQEGNLGLMIGLDTIGLMEEGMTFERHLENEIHRAIRAALDEQEGSRSTGEQVAEKLNKLADSITQLTEELGREVTPDELSLYLDMPLEEIEDLLRIAGENIETAEKAEEK